MVEMKRNFYEVKTKDFDIEEDIFYSFVDGFTAIKACFIENEMCVKWGEFYAFADGAEVKVFSGENFALRFEKWGEGELTALSKSVFEGEGKSEENQQHFLETVVSRFTYLMGILAKLNAGELKSKRSTRGNACSYKIKGFNIEVRHFVFDKVVSVKQASTGVFDIGIGYMGYRTYKVPSSLRPLPNNGKSKCFTSENTFDLQDDGELASILAEFTPELSKCYSNTDMAFALLEKSGYTERHTVEFYSGWFFGATISSAIHHAWLVVDGTSVIDFSWQKNSYIFECEAKMNEGVPVSIDREKWAKQIHEEKKLNIPFGCKFYYGRVDEKRAYIGCVSSSHEARESFNALLEKYPNHVDYDNVDKKTMRNRLNDIYYSKYAD